MPKKKTETTEKRGDMKRQNIRYLPDQLAKWKRAAAQAGMAWTVWAPIVLEREADSTPNRLHVPRLSDRRR